jgi:hypothetical protein
MLRAILIDPETRAISEVEYEGVYTDIYNLIKNDGSPFDVRPLADGEVLYFDDEFLLKVKEGEKKTYTFINGLPDPIGGRCLIVGTDGGGNDISSKITIDEVELNSRFRDLTLEGWTPGYSKEVEHPVHGMMTHIVGPRPIFKECDVQAERTIEQVQKDDKVYAAKRAAMKQLADFFEGHLLVSPSESADFMLKAMRKHGKKDDA